MIEDDFYATIKLKCGDEIFCKVAASEEEGRTMLLVSIGRYRDDSVLSRLHPQDVPGELF